MATILITLLIVLITLLMPTHQPPSRCPKPDTLNAKPSSVAGLCLGTASNFPSFLTVREPVHESCERFHSTTQLVLNPKP